MTAYLKNKFALSDKGAKNLVKAIWSCTFLYISFMFPVGLLYLVLRALLAPYVGITAKLQPLIVYVGISVVLIGIIGIFQYIEYNATFLASYEESANKRISIAERLREIPLSFFAKKDLSDLTTTIMSDCAGLEKAFSHFIPELLGAVISILLVGVGLLIFDYRMAIALLWVIPVAFLICIGGKNKQTKQNIIHQRAKLKRADAIKECIETVREIKANNQSEKYLANIDEILTYSEKINIKAELNTALYVASAQMLLRVGIATMVLMGVKLIAQGTLDFLTLLMFLIAVSRVFDPLSTALINLAAIFETELKVDRMKEIENQQIQSGKTNERFDNYDIKFENVKFSYKNNNKENV
ncbi:MAG: ABC transporter transmembrane domain-containing protein, partial [Terrisporobacter sp.]|uniref:ABC transporter transmembrane domain-containing protein n=1 Tax=Terrisporobacter sp. TaxID=1965305 RepID=UPI003991A59F